MTGDNNDDNDDDDVDGGDDNNDGVNAFTTFMLSKVHPPTSRIRMDDVKNVMMEIPKCDVDPPLWL